MVVHALDVLGHGLLGCLIDGGVDVLVTENSSRRHLVVKFLGVFCIWKRKRAFLSARESDDCKSKEKVHGVVIGWVVVRSWGDGARPKKYVCSTGTTGRRRQKSQRKKWSSSDRLDFKVSFFFRTGLFSPLAQPSQHKGKVYMGCCVGRATRRRECSPICMKQLPETTGRCGQSCLVGRNNWLQLIEKVDQIISSYYANKLVVILRFESFSIPGLPRSCCVIMHRFYV